MKRKPKEVGLWKKLRRNPLFNEALKRQAEQDTSCPLLGVATSRSMTRSFKHTLAWLMLLPILGDQNAVEVALNKENYKHSKI